GLYSFDDHTMRFEREDLKLADAFPSVIVLSMLYGENNVLWVSVPGGLLQLSNEKGSLKPIRTFGLKDGLKNDYVTAVTQDVQQNIWLSNTTGIATIRKKNGTVVNLDDEQGRVYAMNIGSYFNDGETIYFGSSNGFFSFDPLRVNLTSSAPDIILSSLKVGNEEVHVGEEINGRVLLEKSIAYSDWISIGPKESVVALGYVNTDFSNSKNLNYYYRVKGLQEDWINNGNKREISFVGLDAGNYTVEIRCTKDNTNFGDTKAIKVNVAPPFWKSNMAYVLYVLMLVGIIAAISQISVNRTRLKAKLEMAKMSKIKEHELYEAKLRFFTNISHELRTPLTLIISPLSEILSKPKLGEGTREKLGYVSKNAHRLLDLINQLLNFRKADQGLLKLQVAPGNIVKFAEEIFLSFKGYAESEGLNFEFTASHESIPLTYDREKMEIVLCNLLSNAFKFTPLKGKVSLFLEMDDQNCTIRVRDNGKGISKENQKKIFNRFFQIQDTESTKIIGSGIGLSLSQKIIELHHGSISVKSKPFKGTEFIVSIPLGMEHFSKEDMLQDYSNTEDIDQYGTDVAPDATRPQMGTLGTREREILLVVDDNKDIRTYLESLFQGTYKVFTAENGLRAKEIAEEIIPDLIISDVMMPEMDGLELCKTLKSKIATSHIPIILLTARTSTVYEVDGLNIGADDYVRKPFEANVLRSRVTSQLENRKKIRSHVQNKLRFEIDTSIQKVDFQEKFVEEAFSLVNEHLDDPNFGIEMLAEKLFMSQSTLYRKIKTLTGMSISGFIRSVRLKKASEILLTQDLKLSAVAYSVGFNDYKYFKRSFIKQYGISPREYREVRKNH
ncbi:MAG: ATP-binding protein, partial [Flavobacteriaceae bacterium]